MGAGQAAQRVGKSGALPADARDSVLLLHQAIGNRATARLMRQPAPKNQPPPAAPRKLPGALRVVIVGHASPRWRSAKDASQADLKNRDLSERRMQEVSGIVERRLEYLLGPNVPIEYLYWGRDDVTGPWGRARMDTRGRGSKDTRREAKGNRRANDPQYRRVDVYIQDTTRSEHHRPSGTTQRREQTTNRWGVAVYSSSSVGAGAAGAVLAVRLKNLNTGRTSDYMVKGGGGAFPGGLSTSAPVDDSYTEFSTARTVGFKDFEGNLVTYTSFGVGATFGGIEGAWITFDDMGRDAAWVDVGGFNVGAQLKAGILGVTGALRQGGTGQSDMYDVPDPDISYEKVGDTQSHSHQAFFDTNSALLSPSGRTALRKFVTTATTRFGHSPKTYP